MCLQLNFYLIAFRRFLLAVFNFWLLSIFPLIFLDLLDLFAFFRDLFIGRSCEYCNKALPYVFQLVV